MNNPTYYVVTSVQLPGIVHTLGHEWLQDVCYQHSLLPSVANSPNAVPKVVMETIYWAILLGTGSFPFRC